MIMSQLGCDGCGNPIEVDIKSGLDGCLMIGKNWFGFFLIILTLFSEYKVTAVIAFFFIVRFAWRLAKPEEIVKITPPKKTVVAKKPAQQAMEGAVDSQQPLLEAAEAGDAKPAQEPVPQTGEAGDAKPAQQGMEGAVESKQPEPEPVEYIFVYDRRVSLFMILFSICYIFFCHKFCQCDGCALFHHPTPCGRPHCPNITVNTTAHPGH